MGKHFGKREMCFGKQLREVLGKHFVKHEIRIGSDSGSVTCIFMS